MADSKSPKTPAGGPGSQPPKRAAPARKAAATKRPAPGAKIAPASKKSTAKVAKKPVAAPAKRAPSKAPASAKPSRDGIVIKGHRDLIRHRDAMIAAVRDRPELLPLLMLNPVLAFRDAGVTISPSIATHILHTVQHPSGVRNEREALAGQVRAALGAEPHPTDPAWLARTLFDDLRVQPLDTRGLRPTYRPAIPDDARERLEALLPRRRRRAAPPLVRVATRPQPLRRLDLDAPLVNAPSLGTRPKRLTLEEMWFYRGAHALVTPLLRLGIIDSNALPILSRDAYRKVKAGAQPHDLLRWVDGIRFPATVPRRRG